MRSHAVLSALLVVATAVATGGCRPNTRGSPDGWPDGDGDTDTDVDTDSDTDWDTDDPCGNAACGPEELCGTDGHGDGLDNDCDGAVDEDCTCGGMGEAHACFAGPPDRRNRGACSDGIQSCDEFGYWGPCAGGVSPTDETCDGMDNDCDGSVDEELRGCDSAVVCPSTRGAAPLSTFTLDGTEIYDGATQSWLWEVECPATVPEGSCPQPTDPTAEITEVYFIASGTYRINVTLVTAEGETLRCSFAVVVQGAGLRVELNWDTQGSGRGDTDVDLHLHRPRTTTEFFCDYFEDVDCDDCYYATCKASSYSANLDWGYEPTDDLSACQDAPHGEGATWRSLGSCYNPRLDVDVIYCDPSTTDATAGSFCAPENINVDNPPQGEPFRIMVNYYSAHSYGGVTHPSVNVYCGGELRASFGGGGEVELRNGSTYGEMNDNWLVADVRFFTDECGRVTCEVHGLEEGGRPVVITGPSFGPPWSW